MKKSPNCKLVLSSYQTLRYKICFEERAFDKYDKSNCMIRTNVKAKGKVLNRVNIWN